MKNYNKKDKKQHLLTWVIGEAILIFAIATIAIVLYDTYINIEVTPLPEYQAEKITKEVNTNNTKDISEMLESASKSIVRNIKDNYK